MEQVKTILLVTGLIKNNKNNILVLLRSDRSNNFKKLWQLPEGKVEYGESLEEALKREIAEETSLQIGNIRLYKSTTVHIELNKTKYIIARVVYKADWTGRVILSSEHTDYQWVDAKNFKKLNKIPGIKDIWS